MRCVAGVGWGFHQQHPHPRSPKAMGVSPKGLRALSVVRRQDEFCSSHVEGRGKEAQAGEPKDDVSRCRDRNDVSRRRGIMYMLSWPKLGLGFSGPVSFYQLSLDL
jgi:hypothetical protein